MARRFADKIMELPHRAKRDPSIRGSPSPRGGAGAQGDPRDVRRRLRRDDASPTTGPSISPRPGARTRLHALHLFHGRQPEPLPRSTSTARSAAEALELAWAEPRRALVAGRADDRDQPRARAATPTSSFSTRAGTSCSSAHQRSRDRRLARRGLPTAARSPSSRPAPARRRSTSWARDGSAPRRVTFEGGYNTSPAGRRRAI